MLSDRAVSIDRVPISALLATGAVHHHLVATHARTRIGIIVETGEAREVHHHCLLTGYGADAINPYLAFEALWTPASQGYLDDAPHIVNNEDVIAAYRKGTAKGMLKVMAKMGISTLQSYKGAQIFEAVGLADEVIERAFKGTASRVQGVDLAVLAEEMERRHALGYPGRSGNVAVLPNPGDFHWRRHGDTHMWIPRPSPTCKLRRGPTTSAPTGALPTTSTGRTPPPPICAGCSRSAAAPTAPASSSTRSNRKAKSSNASPPGAMSFGSISAEAHESLAIAMNRIGGKSNTGEGGEDARRYAPLPNGDSKRSAIKQVASGRFGVTIDYLTNADELQIKIVQGAKPGEGGELPGHKVDDIIAGIRHSTPGVGLISPPPHHDIYSIEDIAQLIHDLKNGNPEARISVKLGAEVGVGAVAAGVTKARSDHLVIAGDSGRHRRLAPHLHQARRPALGARHRRGAPDPGGQQPALAGGATNRRPAQNRARCGHCLPARRRRIRLGYSPPGNARLHHDAQMPPQHLPGGYRHPGSGTARKVYRPAGTRHQLLVHGGERTASDHGRPGVPDG